MCMLFLFYSVTTRIFLLGHSPFQGKHPARGLTNHRCLLGGQEAVPKFLVLPHILKKKKNSNRSELAPKQTQKMET